MFGILSPPKIARLDSIYICQSAGQPMQSLSSILAVRNEGLLGDRYQSRKGYWDPVEGCQVTIITLAEIARAQKKTSAFLKSGEHRRNLVLSAIHPKRLINRTIQIGEAVFQYQKPRPPCGYLDQLVVKGAAKALSKNSGSCFKVLTGGQLSVGDEVVILP